MKQHQPQDQPTSPPNGAVAASAVWVAWVREQWAAVRVLHLDVTRLADMVGRVRVRAVVHLGPLSPADVRVDAVAGAAESLGRPEQRTSGLYSAQSYHNGTFVFEGFTEIEALDGEQLLTVLVRPRSVREELSGLSVVGPSATAV